MLAATSKFLRQIVPPVIATLIAALLIAGFNRAFSVHLTQPRMAAMGVGTDAPSDREQPKAAPQPPSVIVLEEISPVREWEKGGGREAMKDQAAVKVTEAAPASAEPTQAAAAQSAPVARKVEPRQTEARPVETRQAEPRQVEPRRPATRHVDVRPLEPRPVEPRRFEPVEQRPIEQRPVEQPVVAAPVTVPAVPAAPPPVVVATPVIVAPPAGEPLMVTVPDRPRARALPPEGEPQYVQGAAPQEQRPQGPIGTIVNTLKPSTWFDRAREFGEKIEAVGNDILPTIRQ